MEEVFRRIKQNPDVESASIWLGSDAYARNTVFQGYTTDSISVKDANIRYVSPEYFDVMRIPIQEGTGMFSTDMNALKALPVLRCHLLQPSGIQLSFHCLPSLH